MSPRCCLRAYGSSTCGLLEDKPKVRCVVTNAQKLSIQEKKKLQKKRNLGPRQALALGTQPCVG